ncbi:MAG: glycosyltransferase [Chitinophagaceae bacterium]|nr:glycosyltransferase [Chitinophagaceae bacterium]
MKILFVAMPESVHTARWISQIADLPGELHLFPSVNCGITNNELRDITVHHSFHAGWDGLDNSVSLKGVPLFSEFASRGAMVVMDKIYPNSAVSRLARLIKRLKPDIIHSLEFQHSAYLTLEAKKRLGINFPPWIVTNWGSDIYLFGRLPEHEVKIRDVLANADYYSCECRRDVCLAEGYGFKGKILPVFPNTGGFDLFDVAKLKVPGPVSGRRTIMLKGYQHWAGRALVGLRALERCTDVLAGYTVTIYSASPDVEIAARLFQQSTGVPVVIVPQNTPHWEILALHGTARISIGLSISDAISTSFLEALVMGSFPIQSWTACADEWIENGKTGLLVPPEDPDSVELAIRRALTDDGMMDRAADVNWRTALNRLDHKLMKQQALELYAAVAGH